MESIESLLSLCTSGKCSQQKFMNLKTYIDAYHDYLVELSLLTKGAFEFNKLTDDLKEKSMLSHESVMLIHLGKLKAAEHSMKMACEFIKNPDNN